MHEKDRFALFSEDEPRVCFVLGTGPSLTDEQIALIDPYRKFGCNLTYKFDLDVHLACNWQWWDYYWSDIKDYNCHKWTPRIESAQKYGINYIEERWEDGLSKSKDYICAHHGSGPQILNLAYLYGAKVIGLLGWDMKYPGKIDNKNYTEKRHYFGEYPKELQHWPRTDPNGDLGGLIREVETIHPADYDIKIINCTPESALTCFPQMSLSQFILEYPSGSDASMD